MEDVVPTSQWDNAKCLCWLSYLALKEKALVLEASLSYALFSWGWLIGISFCSRNEAARSQVEYDHMDTTVASFLQENDELMVWEIFRLMCYNSGRDDERMIAL
ncbi:hypothetical protein ACH5RR_039030 [Cinchona calisaya]|uniref:Uncharacterized protein n=1 Tax=Cinchona calisaya TaxID=153742 RepID=A0ABD2Y284_9GENT